MFRIDHATAAGSLPSPAALGTPGFFAEGDPVAGVPATVVTADWLNAVQEELANAIEGAGLTLDKTNRAQLLAAIGLITESKIPPALPAGTVLYVAQSSAPTGFLKCNGTAVSRTTYAALFAAIGTTFGAGNGSTTFNLPDLRGEFIRGFDDGRGKDSGRAFGSAQTDAFKSHSHPSPGGVSQYVGFNPSGPDSIGGGSGDYVTFNNTGNAGGTETRPTNVALLPVIKY